MLKIIAKKQRTIKYKSRDDSVSMQTKTSACDETKDDQQFGSSLTKSFFHVLTFLRSNPLPQVNSFKNRELNAKQPQPIRFAALPGRPANPTYKVCCADWPPGKPYRLAHLNYRMVGNNMVEFNGKRHKQHFGVGVTFNMVG